MKANEEVVFGEMLTSTLEVYGARLTPGSIGIWWQALKRYPLDDVRGALSAHVQSPQQGKFAPKPADLIGLLQANDGRPGAEEAWSNVAYALGDESATVVLTEEEKTAFWIADALSDDRVAARMAFKESYILAVQKARDQGKPVKWDKILGHNDANRESVLLEAVRLGRLPRDHVQVLLPYLEIPSTEVLEPAGNVRALERATKKVAL